MAGTHYTTLLPPATHVSQAAKSSPLVNEDASSFPYVLDFSLHAPRFSVRKKIM